MYCIVQSHLENSKSREHNFRTNYCSQLSHCVHEYQLHHPLAAWQVYLGNYCRPASIRYADTQVISTFYRLQGGSAATHSHHASGASR
jgi:hypothetical protein